MSNENLSPKDRLNDLFYSEEVQDYSIRASTTINDWLGKLGLISMRSWEENKLDLAYATDELPMTEEKELYEWFCKEIITQRYSQSTAKAPDLSLLALPYIITTKETVDKIDDNLKTKFIFGFGIKS